MRTWAEICDDPNLRDLPYKIEQDKWGHIVLSPTKSNHGEFQSEIVVQLRRLLPDWVALVECAIATPEGAKVPDVAAMTRARRRPTRGAADLPIAPEICVEVISWSNTPDEMDEKRRLYAGAGCQEFWTCDENGLMTFFNAASGAKLEQSALCPGFPARLILD